jgi:hypothetical protein
MPSLASLALLASQRHTAPATATALKLSANVTLPANTQTKSSDGQRTLN